LSTILSENPESISIAEPCAGTAFLTIKTVEYLRQHGFTGKITAYVNDYNTTIIRLLKMLFEGHGSELIQDPDYIQKAVSLRAGIISDNGYVYPKHQEMLQRNTPKLLQLFDEIHTTLRDVDVRLSSKKNYGIHQITLIRS
jgi:hypothetical protein